MKNSGNSFQYQSEFDLFYISVYRSRASEENKLKILLYQGSKDRQFQPFSVLGPIQPRFKIKNYTLEKMIFDISSMIYSVYVQDKRSFLRT